MGGKDYAESDAYTAQELQRPWTSQEHASWVEGSRMGPTRPVSSPVEVAGARVVDSFFIGATRDRSPEKGNRGATLIRKPSAIADQVYCSVMYSACLPWLVLTSQFHESQRPHTSGGNPRLQMPSPSFLKMPEASRRRAPSVSEVVAPLQEALVPPCTSVPASVPSASLQGTWTSALHIHEFAKPLICESSTATVE